MDRSSSYRPFFSIIANVSLDHTTIEKTSGMFETLGRNTKEITVVNSDDPHLSRCHFENPVWFSIDTESAYRPEAIEYHPLSTTFRLHGEAFTLSLPGKYNLYNALSCIALLAEMGIPLRDISGALPDFSGIERRFDIHLNDGRHLVIDDYAHNPHKIASLMETVKNISPAYLLYLPASRVRSDAPDETGIYRYVYTASPQGRPSHPASDLLRRRNVTKGHSKRRPAG